MKYSVLFSVLMPVYNAEKLPRQAIDSILSQTYSNFELLICDDFSTDKSQKIISSYRDERIRTFCNDKNIGYLRTFNKLIEQCKGCFITFQDADDYSHPKRLELLLNALIQNSNTAICESNFTMVDRKGQLMETSDFARDHMHIENGISQRYEFIGSALMIRREVYEKIVGYHTFFNRMGQEDHYWIFQALQHFKIMNIPEHLYYYRFNPESVSGNLSNNPSKLNSQKIIEFLIHHYRGTGTDLLLQGRDEELRAIIDEMNKPFTEELSYFFYYIAKRRFYEGKKKIAIKNIWKAIQLKPFYWHYYKDLYYFLKTCSSGKILI